MAPKWLANDAKLAADEQLRELQLKWFRDDIWMRRIAFSLFVFLTLAGAFSLVLQPFPHAPGVGLLCLVTGPLSWLVVAVRRWRR